MSVEIKERTYYEVYDNGRLIATVKSKEIAEEWVKDLKQYEKE